MNRNSTCHILEMCPVSIYIEKLIDVLDTIEVRRPNINSHQDEIT